MSADLGSATRVVSVFEQSQKLSACISEGKIGAEVLDLVIPDGEPLLFEKELWDYKLSLPILRRDPKPHRTECDQHALFLSQIVKDAVSFHNSYGGYLVIGVRDAPREVAGFDQEFDTDGLNAAIQSATDCNIDCHFTLLPLGVGKPKVGLLYFPRRSDSATGPVQFRKNAPKSGTGNMAYKKGDIYLRDGHESRPAHSSDDYAFLCCQGRRVPTMMIPSQERSLINHTLPPKDPGFIKLVGHSDYFSKLWEWLVERHTPVRLLSGLGGVGKTTIAREFVEQVVLGSPLGLERVIWLSAKPRFFTAFQGKYVEAGRIDFSDTKSLLVALLEELATPGSLIDPDLTLDELAEEAAEALQILPSLVVVDDIDTLTEEEQSSAFHQIISVVGKTFNGRGTRSKAILTARLDLGAAPSQLMRVHGLPPTEFKDFVHMSLRSFALPADTIRKSQQMDRFHKVTDGSPTFATSILRLVKLGDNIEMALTHWRGGDGEDARRFAFEKEIDTLTESQTRTLFALCTLGESPASELRQIVESNRTRFQDDIGALGKFHLIANESLGTAGGARLSIPSSIRLMSGLLKEKIHDPKKIERRCAKARSKTPGNLDLGDTIRRVVALWNDGSVSDALDISSFASEKNPNDGDLRCLLGRAHLRLAVPDSSSADSAFRRAFELGCKRPELMGLWIEAKLLLKDWMGLIDVSRIADERNSSADNIYYMAHGLFELAALSESSGDVVTASRRYLEAGVEIQKRFSRKTVTGRVNELRKMKSVALENYVHIVDRVTTDPNKYIDVWIAVTKAHECHVRRGYLVRLGILKLRQWWDEVEQREHIDFRTSDLMAVQLEKLEAIRFDCYESKQVSTELIRAISETLDSLNKRLDEYVRKIGT